MELKFRPLKATEIDVTVEKIWATGCTLMLYKNARVDMNLLDECVGPLRWTRKHSKKFPNYCAVSIFDENTKSWITKEDFGEPAEGEYATKAMASDSFKRCCTNWGIGRQLYSAPSIKLTSNSVTICQDEGRFYTLDDFSVSSIEYSEDETEIVSISIKNNTKNCLVYTYTAAQGENTINKNDAVCKPVLVKEKPADTKRVAENTQIIKNELPVETNTNDEVIDIKEPSTFVVSGIKIEDKPTESDNATENKPEEVNKNTDDNKILDEVPFEESDNVIDVNAIISTEEPEETTEIKEQISLDDWVNNATTSAAPTPVMPVVPEVPTVPNMEVKTQTSSTTATLDDPYEAAKNVLVDVGASFISRKATLGTIAPAQVRWVYTNTKSEQVKAACIVIAQNNDDVKKSFIVGKIPIK